MKNLYKEFIGVVLIATFLMMGITNANAVEVTFKVDMAEQEVSPDGVHIAGNFQGWNPATTELTKSPFNDVYSYTQDFQPGESLEFKYINGNAWGMDESVPAGCSQNSNRYLIVPDENIELSIVCFGSCIACNPPLIEITFQVDMSNQTVSANGVHVAGSFQGWNPAATEMLPVGNEVYAVTVEIGEGEYIEYKFINGNAWGGDETVPGSCAAGGNRYYTVSTSETLPAVCFGSCDPCGGAVVDVNVTFTVDMSQQTISPDGVHIAGGFQGWDPATTLMTDAGDGIYTFTAILQSSSYQEYKFVNGDEWGEAESVPVECSFNNNRFFTTPNVDTTLGTVCYNMCDPCPLPVDVEVTFQVDMTEQTVSENGVHLIGSFNNYDPTATPMALLRNGIYTATLTLTENDEHLYKFVNGNELTDEETVPGECAQEEGYREVIIPGENLVIDDVCFGACGPCIPPPSTMVEFLVDMTNEEVDQEGVHIAGSFQGWDPAATPMTDAGDGIYSITLELIVGEHHIYKFINGNTFDGQETVPAECGEDDGFGGYNRFVDVIEEMDPLPLVCFSTCGECIPPVYVDITFMLDMQNEEVSPDGVFIAGSFQGWNTATDQMTLMEDQIYSYTTTLVAGDYHEFKYINGNTVNEYETVPQTCASNDGNRFLTVPDVVTALDVVCFGTCSACVPPVEVDVLFEVDMSNQLVSAEGVHVAGSFNGFDPVATALDDMGNGLYSVVVTLIAGEHHTYKFINGASFDFAETVPSECGEDDGFGGYNRYLDVTDAIAGEVCFSSCDACERTQVINLFAGWNSLSGYRLPDDADIEIMMSQIVGELVVMQTMTTVYYPDGGVNTIGVWESQSAYKLKVTEDVILNITGIVEQSKTLQLVEGWNLIPVLSDQPVDVETLFAGVISDVVVVKGVAEIGIFWPEYSINTLVHLGSGKAYYVKMNAAGEITYP